MLPLLRRMIGLPDDTAPTLRAVLTEALPGNGPRAHYMRARIGLGQMGGLPQISPFRDQDSSLLTVLSQADALLVRAPHEGPRAAGDEVPYMSLDSTNR